jgi:hypothetical protein
METVSATRWTRLHGLLGLPGSRKLYVIFSLYLSLSKIVYGSNFYAFRAETVETDLQAGANHRYDVHYLFTF